MRPHLSGPFNPHIDIYVIFLRQIKVFVFSMYFRIVYPEAHLCLKLSGEVKLAQIFI